MKWVIAFIIVCGIQLFSVSQAWASERFVNEIVRTENLDHGTAGFHFGLAPYFKDKPGIPGSMGTAYIRDAQENTLCVLIRGQTFLNAPNAAHSLVTSCYSASNTPSFTMKLDHHRAIYNDRREVVRWETDPNIINSERKNIDGREISISAHYFFTLIDTANNAVCGISVSNDYEFQMGSGNISISCTNVTPRTVKDPRTDEDVRYPSHTRPVVDYFILPDVSIASQRRTHEGRVDYNPLIFSSHFFTDAHTFMCINTRLYTYEADRRTRGPSNALYCYGIDPPKAGFELSRTPLPNKHNPGTVECSRDFLIEDRTNKVSCVFNSVFTQGSMVERDGGGLHRIPWKSLSMDCIRKK